MLIVTSIHEPQGPDAQIRVLNATGESLVLQSEKPVTKSPTVEVPEASEKNLGSEHLPIHLEETMLV